MSAVRLARDAEIPAVVRTLSLAFEDDPVMSFLFPDAASRLRRLRGFYAVVVPLIAGHGHVHTDDGVRGAAVWMAPSPPPPDLAGGAWLALRMLLTLRGAMGRANALNRTIQPTRPYEPHWYLALLGTGPAHQGRGLGSALLEPTLSRCDREAVPAYLESSKRENLPFYERHGFEVLRELHIPDGPPVWLMMREPRAGA